MERFDVQAVKESVSCVDLASRYVKLHKASRNEFAGPCPRCGGTDRLHVKPDGWFCRTCYPIDEHGWHSAPDFIMWIQGVTFPEAIQMLQGNAVPSAPTQTLPAPKPPTVKMQAPSWRTQAKAECDAAAARLSGSPGMEYLFSRGICEETMRTYKLGYMEKPWMVAPEFQQPAIVMPWMKGGAVVGIRYRFLKPVNGQRVRSAADSDFAGKLFGGQALWISPDSLPAMFAKRRFVLCEGELNAMSIAQDMRDMQCDVLSIGSESQSLTEAQIAFAKRYGTRIVWMDKPSMRDKFVKLLGAQAGIASQPTDDKGIAKTDANDALLKDSLTNVMIKAMRRGPDAELLRWDLQDAGLA